MMNGIFIVPTGLGFEIGGHAGDATPAARLIASTVDKLIVHPNVVNASDINEMTDNMLYVEGSMLDNFLTGTSYLQEVKSNRIMVAVNKPVTPEVINVVSAARAVLGADVFIWELETPITMTSKVDGNGASGEYDGVLDMLESLQDNRDHIHFDALALATPVKVDDEVTLEYLRGGGGINPWGGIEAIVSREVSNALGKPVAHAPVAQGTLSTLNEVVDPRMAAEMLSLSYLFSVIKGLHKAPRVDLGKGLHVSDIDFMISPATCYGPPHTHCIMRNIPNYCRRKQRSGTNSTPRSTFSSFE